MRHGILLMIKIFYLFSIFRMERPPMNQPRVEQKQAEIQRPTESFADARARLQQIVDRLQQETEVAKRSQILEELQRERQPLIERAVLVCPRNDMEAETIFRLAEKLGLVTIASDQGHGATLDKEPGIVEALKHTTKPDVFIVEIPSIEEEGNIASNNQEVHIIDHHRYGSVDRSREESSLDQFIDHFAITDDELMEMGYDPMVVRCSN